MFTDFLAWIRVISLNYILYLNYFIIIYVEYISDYSVMQAQALFHILVLTWSKFFQETSFIQLDAVLWTVVSHLVSHRPFMFINCVAVEKTGWNIILIEVYFFLIFVIMTRFRLCLVRPYIVRSFKCLTDNIKSYLISQMSNL